jgi:hypothetical protein
MDRLGVHNRHQKEYRMNAEKLLAKYHAIEEEIEDLQADLERVGEMYKQAAGVRCDCALLSIPCDGHPGMTEEEN